MDKYFDLLDSLESQHGNTPNLKTIMRTNLQYHFGAMSEADYIIRHWEQQKRDALLNKLDKAAKNHDWFYMMSDDHRAYINGTDEAEEIHLLIHALRTKGLEDEALAIVDKYVPDSIKLVDGWRK